MTQVKCCYKNILESSNVTLSAGTADSSYPLYRLYERNIGLTFRTTAAVTTEIKVDQGASGNLAIDQLLIPAGHNLNGVYLTLQYSDNNVDWVNVHVWTQGDALLINKSWTSITHRYWRFNIIAPASIPQIPELFLSPSYEWEQNPSLPTGPSDPIFNAENLVTAGGSDRFLIHGDAKKQRVYDCKMITDTQKTNIVALNDAWAGAKPFFLCDHNGTWIFGKLTGRIEITQQSENETTGHYDFKFPFQEVLP